MAGIKNMEQAAVLTLKEQVAYQPGQVVSKTLAQNDVFGTIEAVKTVSDAFLPVSGEIVEFNAAVDADPAVVNKDPYGEGWLVKVQVSNPAEYDALLTAQQYAELIG